MKPVGYTDLVRDEILLEGLDDYIGIWEVARRVEDDLPGARVEEVQDTSLAIVKDVLERGLMTGGFAKGDGSFENLELSVEKTLDRVQRDWDTQKGPLPGLGDGIWFNLTEKGEVWARKLDRIDGR